MTPEQLHTVIEQNQRLLEQNQQLIAMLSGGVPPTPLKPKAKDGKKKRIGTELTVWFFAARKKMPQALAEKLLHNLQNKGLWQQG